LAPRTIDLTHIDTAAFARDVDALHDQLVADLGPADLTHLKKMIRWTTICAVIGYATAPICPNPISAFLISVATFSRWIVMHHVGHRGYDRVPGVPERLTSRGFARGKRRYLDWLDWMLPEAWIHEHNSLHHSRTGEEADPDLVERNALILRASGLPVLAKAVFVAFVSSTWKFLYYAPNTIRELHRAKRSRAGNPDAMSAEESARLIFDLRDPRGRAELYKLIDPRTPAGRQLWTECLCPYALLRFGVIPALFAVFGWWAWLSVLINSLVAEMMTNIHAFMTITPNHAGDDLPRFVGRTHDKAEFFVRQVAGSVNYTGGTDLQDFLQGYLNYQIEHHVWTDLPMLKYRQAQPRMEEICRRHGVPYRRENIFRRVFKLVDIMIGRSSMPVGVTRATATGSTSSQPG